MYADVIVNISHDDLDRPFRYRIPPELEDLVLPGARVEVPFGKQRALIGGYVVELCDTAGIDPAKIKDIARVAGAQSGGKSEIAKELIELAAWIKSEYGGTMNQALGTVFPTKCRVRTKVRKMVYLELDKDSARRNLSLLREKRRFEQARLLKALTDISPITQSRLRGDFSVSSRTVSRMEEIGWISVKEESDAALENESLYAQKKQHIKLNAVQHFIADDIISRMRKGDKRTSLIHGVTGSGKTELYMELIERVIAGGRQAVFLIPEIALSYQMESRFAARFGRRVSMIHSSLSPGERARRMRMAENGTVDLMIGPRSALFTPFPSLGLIVIDEEHDQAYKSENVPRYHARETAERRAKLCGGIMVIGSATPSLESYKRALGGQWKLYRMPDRIDRRPMPTVHLVDLRRELKSGNRSPLSMLLQEKIRERLSSGRQIMLFLNRRGVAGFVSCRSCGAVIKCPRCDVSLKLHEGGVLRCHYCAHKEAEAKLCPLCGSPFIGTFRAGTQRIERDIKSLFPKASVLRLDTDTAGKQDGYRRILQTFGEGKADILVGTQMIVKGHDFPRVTLVGVLAADLSLAAQDFRAGERTYQLLSQASGRCGRGDEPGEVVIQSYQPDHYSVQAAAVSDYESFYSREMSFRAMMHYPPAWHMLVIHLSSIDERGLSSMAERFVRMAKEEGADEIIGPAPAPVSKVRDIYRMLIYIKAESTAELSHIRAAIEEAASAQECRNISLQFDLDPMDGF